MVLQLVVVQLVVLQLVVLQLVVLQLVVLQLVVVQLVVVQLVVPMASICCSWRLHLCLGRYKLREYDPIFRPNTNPTTF